MQLPTRQTRGLYELLTDPDIVNGIPITFSDGLSYVVGTGFLYDGERITLDEAKPMLRDRWQVRPRLSRRHPYLSMRTDNPRRIALWWAIDEMRRIA